MNLKGFQRKYLRGLAHNLKPAVMVGQKGLSDSLVRAIDEALDSHELIKVKFIDCKEKDQKKTLAETIQSQTAAEVAGSIGHTLILYRQQNDPQKRRIKVPGLHS